MTDQLRIASALRKTDDAALEKLISLRSINSSHLRDLFDLADVLAQPKSVLAALSSLTARQFAQLEFADTVSEGSRQIFDLMLAEETASGPSLFDCTRDALNALTLAAEKKSIYEISAARFGNSIAEVDRDASLAIFDVIQALTELIFELEQRYVREVSKRQVGLPDIKRLANHLKKSNDYAKQIFELASLCSLAEVDSGRWQLGPNAGDWVVWSDAQRWAHLAKTWLDLLGEEASRELLQLAPAQFFSSRLTQVFPYADTTASNNIKKVAELAELIGLTAGDQSTSWLATLTEMGLLDASTMAAAGLPAVEERLIIQGDLTLIAPSPLPTATEIQLRRFADTEQIGMASSYRLSALSVSHGLETGMTIDEIRAMLQTLSDKSLPQPVDYLLKEAQARFARLRISSTKAGAHSEIVSSDRILLAEIHNDQRLKPFALHFDEEGKLHSRFESELVYFALREANFVAVRVDADGGVISPLKRTSSSQLSNQKRNVLADITRMREADTKGTSDPDDDDLLRQLQLAIKNKARVSIKLTTQSGDEVEYLVEPVGVANGRLRAKDRKADLERTLPLSSVVSITIQ